MHPSKGFDTMMMVAKEHMLVDEVMDLSKGEERAPSIKHLKKEKGEGSSNEQLTLKLHLSPPSEVLHFAESSQI